MIFSSYTYLALWETPWGQFQSLKINSILNFHNFSITRPILDLMDSLNKQHLNLFSQGTTPRSDSYDS